MIDFYDEDILIDCLESALTYCDGVRRKTGSKFNFRCHICGDSKRNERKKRAWILKNKSGVWIYNCFNCGIAMSAIYWIKKYHPSVYRDYIKKVLRKEKKPKIKEVSFHEIKKIENEVKPKYPFHKITDKDEPLMKQTIRYCEERKISKDIYLGWHICYEGNFKNRLIIPYYNQEGKIYSFIARTLVGEEPKYKFPIGEKKFYNIFNIDRQKPVLILEGPIDSLFCENSIAIGGAKLSENQKEQIKNLDCYFIMDSDETGKKKSLDLLKEGRNVFLWRKFLKDNNLPELKKWDLNMVYIEMNRKDKFTFEELKPYFTNSIYSESYLK